MEIKLYTDNIESYLKSDHVVLDASFPAKKIYIKRGYEPTEYNMIETENGDYLCFDVMEKSI
jgi:hypothetical protein